VTQNQILEKTCERLKLEKAMLANSLQEKTEKVQTLESKITAMKDMYEKKIVEYLTSQKLIKEKPLGTSCSAEDVIIRCMTSNI